MRFASAEAHFGSADMDIVLAWRIAHWQCETQCESSTGTVIVFSTVRVTPPNTTS